MVHARQTHPQEPAWKLKTAVQLESFNKSQRPNEIMRDIASHYIVNARGPNNVFHISDGHATTIDCASFANNLQ